MSTGIYLRGLTDPERPENPEQILRILRARESEDRSTLQDGRLLEVDVVLPLGSFYLRRVLLWWSPKLTDQSWRNEKLNRVLMFRNVKSKLSDNNVLIRQKIKFCL